MGIKKAFSTTNGLDVNNKSLTNLADPINDSDAATQKFSSNASNLTTGILALDRLPNQFHEQNTFNLVNVDIHGIITSGSNVPYLTKNNQINVSGDVSGCGDELLNLTLSNTGVQEGVYNSNNTTLSPFTVDSKGRIIKVGSEILIQPEFSSIKNTPSTLSGYGITNSLDISINQTANTFLAASSISDSTPEFRKIVPSDIPILNQNTSGSAKFLSTITEISFIGDISASYKFNGLSNVVVETELTDVIKPGTYNISNNSVQPLTVDSKGRIIKFEAPIDIKPEFTNIKNKPSTLGGYGITDAVNVSHIGSAGTSHDVVNSIINGFMSSEDKIKLDSIDVNANNYEHDISPVLAGTYKSVTVDDYGHVIAGTNPSTLAGYGITDAASNKHSHLNINLSSKILNGLSIQSVDNSLDGLAESGIKHAVLSITHDNVTSKNHQLGFTDSNNIFYKSSDSTWVKVLTSANLTDLSQLTNSPNYLSENQEISITGDIIGVGKTSIHTSLAYSGVNAGTYKSVTVDAKGRVTAGTNPTTLAGYGITDAITKVDSILENTLTLKGTLLELTSENSIIKLGSTIEFSNDAKINSKSILIKSPIINFSSRPTYNNCTPYDTGNLSIAEYSTLESPQFTGIPTVPNPESGNKTNQIASTAFVLQEIEKSSTFDTLYDVVEFTNSEVIFKVPLTKNGHEIYSAENLTPSNPPINTDIEEIDSTFWMENVQGTGEGFLSFGAIGGIGSEYDEQMVLYAKNSSGKKFFSTLQRF